MWQVVAFPQFYSLFFSFFPLITGLKCSLHSHITNRAVINKYSDMSKVTVICSQAHTNVWICTATQYFTWLWSKTLIKKIWCNFLFNWKSHCRLQIEKYQFQWKHTCRVQGQHLQLGHRAWPPEAECFPKICYPKVAAEKYSNTVLHISFFSAL